MAINNICCGYWYWCRYWSDVDADAHFDGKAHDDDDDDGDDDEDDDDDDVAASALIEKFYTFLLSINFHVNSQHVKVASCEQYHIFGIFWK